MQRVQVSAKVESEGVQRIAFSDDLGRFRIFGLPAGNYRIDVDARDELPGAIATPIYVNLIDGGVVAGVTTLLRVEPPAWPEIAGTIRGTVVFWGRGNGVPNVSVEVIREGQSGYPKRIGTDRSGAFVADHLPLGTYRLHARKSGLLRSLPHEWGDGDAVVTITPGALEASAHLQVMEQGVIAGQAHSRIGPAVRALVSANRQTHINGELALETAATAYTDDRGVYRLFGLQPRTYYVRAEAACGEECERKNRRPQPTFYPQAENLLDAIPVKVHPGSDEEGLDLNIPEVAQYQLGGRVAIMTGTGKPEGRVTLSLRELGLQTITPVLSGELDNSGAFRVKHVPPGNYILRATVRINGEILTGATPVDVRYEDVKDITIPVRGTIDLVGQVTQKPDSACALAQQSVLLRSMSIASEARRYTAGILADGTFTVDHLVPDHYEISLQANDAGCFIEDIALGSATADPKDLPLLSIGNLRVSVSSQSATLRGVVRDSSLRIRPDTIVLVLGSDDDAPRRIRTSPDGEYLCTGLPPENTQSWRCLAPL